MGGAFYDDRAQRRRVMRTTRAMEAARMRIDEMARWCAMDADWEHDPKCVRVTGRNRKTMRWGRSLPAFVWHGGGGEW